TPARLANFSRVRRHSFERLFVKIEDQPVRTVAYCMCLDLNAAAKRFFKHRLQFFRLLGQITGSIRRIGVRFEQGSAARTERSVEDHFDRALREMMVERVNGCSFT